MTQQKVVLDEDDIRRTLVRIAHEIVEKNSGRRRRSRGDPPPRRPSRHAPAPARLRPARAPRSPLGEIDIAFYRDDLATAGRTPSPVVHASHLPLPARGPHASSSSTTCSTPAAPCAPAIEALFDYGRPARVQLAVLADRGHRELPIRPDYVGKNLPTARAERVNVRVDEVDGVDEVTITSVEEVACMRHLLSIEDLDRAGIERILDRAKSFTEVSEREIKKVPALRGRRVLNLFYEASTRTRSSFELAAKSLSADVINFVSSGSSVEKGESLKDTVQTLTRLPARPDRDPHAARRRRRARGRLGRRASVVNAGDGKHEHPTQALLDVYTLRERLGPRRAEHLDRRRRPALRVARSNILAFTKMGAKVTVCGPPTLIPRGIEALCASRVPARQASSAGRRRLRAADAEGAHDGQLRAAHPRVRARRTRSTAGGSSARQVLMHPGPSIAGSSSRPRSSTRRRRSSASRSRPASSSAWRCSTSCWRPNRARTRRVHPGPRSSRDGALRSNGGLMDSPLVDRDSAPADVLIRDAHVLDPRAGIDEPYDVLAATARSPRSARRLPRRRPVPRCSTAPAPSVPRLRRPARALPHARPGHKEDLDTGTRAAAAGGFVAVIAMPKHLPVVDSAPMLRSLRERRGGESPGCPSASSPRVTPRLAGDALTEMAELRESARSASPTTASPSTAPASCASALQYQRLCGGSSRCTRRTRRCPGQGVMHEGDVCARLGLAGIPAIGESTMIARDAAIAGYEELPHPHPAPERARVGRRGARRRRRAV